MTPATPPQATPPDLVRSAATVVLWRPAAAGFEVLMGQRGHAAAFMPSKYVFPGGGVDAADATDGLPGLTADCAHRLTLNCPADAPSPGTLTTAALRELTEETGLSLPNPAPGTLRFMFRAITPPGRSRRFDARFFLAPAAHAVGETENFSESLTELSHLHWIGLSAARALDLPFITEVVLAEASAILAGQTQPGVPFFDNSGPIPTFRRL
ncbi:MAG: DNA mismatch repair protein MutT [Pseudorhodobacter sp. PARRP1]|nr:MAG: DNA mismatch repair protein MutT [Pseudorhodobacter sp. PARRP1]